MTKKTSVLSILACITVAGLAYFVITVRQTKSPDTATGVSPPLTAASQETQIDTSTSTGSGVYTEYSAEAVSSTRGRRVLFFHAPWCPQCRSLEKSIQSGSIPSDVTIFKVDYDTNQKLRQKYGVTLQTTVVLLDDNGEAAKKFVPYDSPSLEAVKEKLL